jgi:hypothetical protein
MSDPEIELKSDFGAIISLCELVAQERPGWWPALVEWDQFKPAYRLRFTKGWGLAWVEAHAPFDLATLLTRIDQADAYHNYRRVRARTRRAARAGQGRNVGVPDLWRAFLCDRRGVDRAAREGREGD